MPGVQYSGTEKDILADVWDQPNHRLRGIAGGSGGVIYNGTVKDILADVWDQQGHFLRFSGGGGGTGTVTSVDLSAPADVFAVSGNPVVGAGTLALTKVSQTANKVYASPSGGSGVPTFRALTSADLPAGTGTVTSVAMTVPADMSIGGSPITTSGTLALTRNNQAANLVFAGPASGGAATPTYRALVTADMPAGTGTVTSVALSMPAEFSTAGSPVTTSGTFTVTKATQTANTVYAGPTSGGAVAPTFRALVAADIPTIAAAAGTLTGTTLAANVVNSSLTSVGVLAAPHMTSPVVDSGGLTVTAGGVTVTGNSTITGTLGGISTITATTHVGALSGNATTATTLATARTINGTSFDGSANITVAAAAGTLTGTTLNATVVTSSLTGVGVLAAPHMTSPVVDSGGLTITSGSITVSAGSGNTFTGVATAGGATLMTWTPGAHTAVTSEVNNVLYAAQTMTITGGYATQRFVRFNQPTITAGSALTVTTAATLAVVGAPIAAGSAVITTPLALWVQGGTTEFDGPLTVKATANTTSVVQFTDGTSAYYTIDTRNAVTGVVAHSLSATGPTIATAGGTATYSVVSIPAVTTTLTGSTTTTALNGLALNIARPTVTDASAVSVSQLSSVYIAGAPILGGSVSASGVSYALHVAQGIGLFSGGVWSTNGTSGAPGYAFASSTNSGMYFSGSQLAFTVAGTLGMYLTGSLLTFVDAFNLAVGSTTGTLIGTATSQVLGLGTKLSKYNNVATKGWGVPAIYDYTRPATQTNTTVTLASYTVGAADGSFEVSANINVTVSTVMTMTVTVSYTDETNTARVLTLPFTLLNGSFVASITTAQGNVPYESPVFHIRCKASTSITIATAGTVTTCTYTGEGFIKQVA